MFKTAVLVSAAALVMAPSAALAQTFGPLGGATVFQGNLNLYHGVSADCDVEIDVSIHPTTGGGVVTDTQFNPGTVFLCGLVFTPKDPWMIAAGPSVWPTEVTLWVSFYTPSSYCEGTVILPYDNLTGELLFYNVAVPGFSSLDCVVNGVLYADPVVEVTP